MQATETELRASREGQVLAAPGDWLVEDDSGAQWMVSNENFAHNYSPI